jgi:hypothetical protein
MIFVINYVWLSIIILSYIDNMRDFVQFISIRSVIAEDSYSWFKLTIIFIEILSDYNVPQEENV